MQLAGFSFSAVLAGLGGKGRLDPAVQRTAFTLGLLSGVPPEQGEIRLAVFRMKILASLAALRAKVMGWVDWYPG
jgi:hypothetical protein